MPTAYIQALHNDPNVRERLTVCHFPLFVFLLKAEKKEAMTSVQLNAACPHLKSFVLTQSVCLKSDLMPCLTHVEQI